MHCTGLLCCRRLKRFFEGFSLQEVALEMSQANVPEVLQPNMNTLQKKSFSMEPISLDEVGAIFSRSLVVSKDLTITLMFEILHRSSHFEYFSLGLSGSHSFCADRATGLRLLLLWLGAQMTHGFQKSVQELAPEWQGNFSRCRTSMRARNLHLDALTCALLWAKCLNLAYSRVCYVVHPFVRLFLISLCTCLARSAAVSVE